MLPNMNNFGILVSTDRLAYLSLGELDDSGNTSYWETIC